jgi:glucose/arabinose dehydrogenase
MSNIEIISKKKNALDAITDVGHAVLEFKVDPLSAAIALREVRRTIEAVEKGIKSQVVLAAMAACEGVPHGIHIQDGYEVTNQEGSGRYDYSSIEEITTLEQQLKDLKEKHKQAYKMHMKGQILVDEDTGEIVTPAGYKGNSPTIRFKAIKKGGK